MTTEKVNEKLSQAATLWQLIMSVVGVLITAVVFIVFLRADVNAAEDRDEKQDKRIDNMEQREIKRADKEDQNQKEILEKLNKIELQIKDKQDRK